MTSIERLVANGNNILNFLKEFTVGSAGDVSITYLNDDGSESVKTFPNIAKQMATFEDWKGKAFDFEGSRANSFISKKKIFSLHDIDTVGKTGFKVYLNKINASDANYRIRVSYTAYFGKSMEFLLHGFLSGSSTSRQQNGVKLLDIGTVDVSYGLEVVNDIAQPYLLIPETANGYGFIEVEATVGGGSLLCFPTDDFIKLETYV